MALRVEVFKGDSDRIPVGRQRWRFRLISTGNHRVMAQSEGYLTKWNAKRAARRAFGRDIQIRVVEPLA